MAASACTRAEAPTRDALPWQPHGLRVPTLACELATPDGFVRSATPMPDHLAELTKPTSAGVATIVVGERVELDIEAAASRVRAVWSAGQVVHSGAALAQDESLSDAGEAAWILARRYAEDPNGIGDVVVLLAFAHPPLVEIVARHPADDRGSRAAAIAVARSLRCR